MENPRQQNNEHRRAIQYVVSTRRDIRAVVDPFNIPDNMLCKNFRLTKPLFRVLMRQITPYLPEYVSPLAISNNIKVLSVLSFYATGSYQMPTSCNWLTCIGRSTLGHFIEEVPNALNHRDLQRRWIKFPTTRTEGADLKHRHEAQFHIPGVVGFVDGTEISIYTPPQALNPQAFCTHKGHYALNVQVSCDSNYVIMAVNASHSGSCNDAFIWGHTALKRRMRDAYQDDQSSWLLGDSAYPWEPWIIVPILDAPEDTPQGYYTECHCKARSCIERCFGVLKCRFRCLLRERVLHYHPVKAGKIVKACCLLHNMCRMARVPDEDLQAAPREEEPACYVPNENEAVAMEMNNPDLDEEMHIENEARDAEVLALGRAVRARVVEYMHLRRQEVLFAGV